MTNALLAEFEVKEDYKYKGTSLLMFLSNLNAWHVKMSEKEGEKKFKKVVKINQKIPTGPWLEMDQRSPIWLWQ